jgi:hypothetical protein
MLMHNDRDWQGEWSDCAYKIFVSGQIKTKTKYPKNQFIKVLTVILLEDVKECLN